MRIGWPIRKQQFSAILTIMFVLGVGDTVSWLTLLATGRGRGDISGARGLRTGHVMLTWFDGVWTTSLHTQRTLHIHVRSSHNMSPVAVGK